MKCYLYILTIIMSKRKLTDIEIEQILKSVQIPTTLSFAKQCVIDNVLTKLKVQLQNIEIYPDMIDTLRQQIRHQYFSTRISPGENVGILVAQSIGEKQTQMSIGYEDYVFIKDDKGLIQNIKIGDFIDQFFITNHEKIVRVREHSWILSMDNEQYYIPSISPKGDIEFKKITMLSRHAPNGDLYKFTTKYNQTVLSTGSHSLLTLQDDVIVPIKATDITTDTKIPCYKHCKNICIKEGKKVCTGLLYTLGIYMRCGRLSDYDCIQFQTRKKRDIDNLKNYCLAKSLKYNYINDMFTFFDKELYNFIIECKSIPMYILSRFEYEDILEFINGITISHKIKKYKIKCITKEMCNELLLLIKLCCPSIKYKVKYIENFYYISVKKNEDTSEVVEWINFVDIQKVDESEYKHKYVYDFSVDEYETFMLANGIFVHNTLNTFHTAGLTVNTVVTGVPRLLELMNTTKEPKSSSCTISIKSETKHFTGVNDIRNYIGPNLRCLTILNLMDDYELMKFSDVKHNWWLKDMQKSDEDDILRIKLSSKIIYENRCSLEQICIKINEIFTDIIAISSSLNDCIIDILIKNKDEITLPKKQICYINEVNKYQVFLEEVVLKKFEKFIICGIDKIKDFSIYTVKPNVEWIISTQGSNLKGLMESGLFDPYNIISNNMWEIYYTLGVEATREFLINEFINVISSDGTFINKCHVLLLVDFMTFKGDISSISRYSLRSKNSPLSRSSFEESIENFLKSGIFSEVDNMKSISANIMTGKLSYTGTGVCDLLMDSNVCFTPKIKSSYYKFDNTHDENDDVNYKINTLPTIFEE